MDISLLEKLLKCPLCEHELVLKILPSPAGTIMFSVSRQLIDFSVAASGNDQAQEWTRKSFEAEWCRYYPRLGWQSHELAHEIEMFLTYTRAMPNFFTTR